MTDTISQKQALPEGWLEVESLDMDAQGVAHRADGKVVFIEGALPFEQVSASVHRKKSNWEQATVAQIHRESSQRVRPGCPHFGLHAGACGGCKMQHLHVGAQVAIKQRVLEDNLWHLGKVRADSILRPVEGPAWGYRYRARLSVRHVHRKGEVLVGFHERKSSYVADMKVCHVLPPHVSALLMPLRALIFSLDARETCPQIELACGDTVTALVLRHLEPLSAGDRARLRAFAVAHPEVQWWLQPKGPQTVQLLDPPACAAPQALTAVRIEPADALRPFVKLRTGQAQGERLPSNADPLSYSLPEFGITMPFRPTDFTQVNPHINRVLVVRALRLLDAQRHERVIDWFCGLGNFTLPIATQAREVLGIEGSEALVARSRENYEKNKALSPVVRSLSATEFKARNLFEMTPSLLLQDGVADKWLVDPPREGAFALVKALAELHQARLGRPDAPPLPEGARNWTPPRRIVYVSCNPATLARDAGLLVHQAGYRCSFAGVVNMFPHTAHVESMAVFDLDAA